MKAGNAIFSSLQLISCTFIFSNLGVSAKPADKETVSNSKLLNFLLISKKHLSIFPFI